MSKEDLEHEVRRLRAENECYAATRSFWPLSLREAIRERDLAAVKAETARSEAVVALWYARGSVERAKWTDAFAVHGIDVRDDESPLDAVERLVVHVSERSKPKAVAP